MTNLKALAATLLLGACFAAQAQFTPPPCTVAQSPSSVQAGGTVTLTATCNGSPTSYSWVSNPAGFSATGNPVSTVVRSTTTYTVTASNAAGPIGSGSRTVIPTAGGVPQCTLFAQPDTIVAGGTASLVASCNPVPTTYNWTNANFTGSGGDVRPTVTTTYTVSGTNASGTGVSSSATVTVSGTGSTPQCTLSASPATITAGGSSMLTATCTPAATSYAWTGTSFGPAISSGSVSPSATTTYTVRGSNGVGAGNTASVTLTVGANTSGANIPGPYSGMWWNRNESGWGIHFTQRGGTIFAAWYTYDANGSPKWYTAASCPIVGTSCTSKVYSVRGPPFFGVPFDSSRVVANDVGTISLGFLDNDHVSVTYSVENTNRFIVLEREIFASSGATPLINFTDLWWNPAESGWGIALTQEFDKIFAAWYVYDSTGKAMWYVAPNCNVPASGMSCSSKVYKTTGPAFGPNFNPAQVVATEAGSASLTFADANNGTLTYNVDGFAGTKAITRQIF